MKTLKKINQFVEEVKQPFNVSDKEKAELESYIHGLEAQKSKLEQSTSVKDIDKLVEINNKYEAAHKMLEKLEVDKVKKKEANSRDIFNEVYELRSEYVNECLKEIEPVYKDIIKRTQELEAIIQKFKSYGKEKTAEFNDSIRQIFPYVSESTKNEMSNGSFLSISQFLENSYKLYEHQFTLWSSNVNKDKK
jgi:hypothetical protein